MILSPIKAGITGRTRARGGYRSERGLGIDSQVSVGQNLRYIFRYHYPPANGGLLSSVCFAFNSEPGVGPNASLHL